MIINKKYCRQATLCGGMCLVLLLTSCYIEEIFSSGQDKFKVDEAGVVVSKPFTWKKKVLEGGGQIEFPTIPIFHNNQVILPCAPYSLEGTLVALDKASGEEVWRWSDFVDGYDFEVVSREGLNSKGNLVIYNDNNLFCAVNLDDGTTLWTDVRPGSSHANAIQIVGDHYYYPYELEENGVKAQVLMRGDIHSSNYEQLIELSRDSTQLFNNDYGPFHNFHIYAESGSIKAFIRFSENIINGQSVNSFISYNISDGVYDFEKVQLPDTVSLGAEVENNPVMIRDMMMISAGDFIYGVNKHTGEVAWTRKVFANSPSDSRIITKAYKDRLFAVNEGGSGSRKLTMELDPLTGETKWIDVGNGGNIYQPICFLNDVMYFIGGDRIYAYDINGGKLLWKLQGPGPFRDNFMTMQVHKAESAEEEDMLVACSWKNVYRFEPAR